MKILITYCCLIGAPILMTGCGTTQAHMSVTTLRNRALDYHYDQIMDNLIRGSNGLPILHVDINNLQAQVTSTVSGSVNGGESFLNSSGTGRSGVNLATLATTASTAVTRPFTFSVNPSRADQITFATSPEVNDPVIYEAYLRFLSLTSPQASLPKDSECHLCVNDAVQSVRKRVKGQRLVEGRDYVIGTLKRWRGEEYYIPIEYRKAYFNLGLAILGRIEFTTAGAGGNDGSKPSKGTPPVRTPGSQRIRTLPKKFDDSEAERMLQQLKSKVDTLQ